MSKANARVILLAFSVCWGAFVFFNLMGSILGDCFHDRYCQGVKEYAAGHAFWRGLAVELMAILAYLLYSRRRTS